MAVGYNLDSLWVSIMGNLTIADALNELKRIDKLLSQREENITRYCSKRRGSKDEIENQKDFVKNQRKSAEDLITRFRDIKIAIQISNLDTKFEFGGVTYSIAEALLIKQQLHQKYTNLYHSFNTQTGESQIMDYQRTLGHLDTSNKEILDKLDLVPEVFYDEKVIMANKESLLELYSHLDSLIEKSNHHTFLNLEQFIKNSAN